MTFHGISAYTGEALAIHTRAGRIARVERSPAAGREPGLPFLSRGFVDIQVNGYGGVDYSAEGLDAEGIQSLGRALAASGTLWHLPTLITGSFQNTLNNLAVISRAVHRDPQAGTGILGIHLEGPYISGQDGARGAHDLRHVRDPDTEELQRWQEAARGLIRLITLAPEREGAIPFIKAAAGMGICVSIGHSLASEEQIARAVDAGARLSTHLGNGSPATLPRLKNPVWAQLANDSLHASLIPDGFHLPASVMKVFARAKGPDRLILVSDASPAGGLPPGAYRWGNIDVQAHPDGRLSLAGTEYLAGAGLLLDAGIPVFMRATGLPLRQVLAMVGQNPARCLGLEWPHGEFAEGEPSDLIRFRLGGGRLEILAYARGSEEAEISLEGPGAPGASPA